jgi:hypothetical protein
MAEVSNKYLDDTDRIVFPDVVVQALRQQYELASVLALNERFTPVPPDINPGRVSDQAFSHSLDPKRLLRECSKAFAGAEGHAALTDRAPHTPTPPRCRYDRP